MQRFKPWLTATSLTLLICSASFAEQIPFGLSLLWPEDQRAFVQDGPGLLLTPTQIEELLALDAVDRERFILRWLQDPVPETPDNELVRAIEARRSLARQEHLTFLDDRARLLFLHGEPTSRDLIDCAETYKPLEIWTYGSEGAFHELVLFRPKPGEPYRLWLPIDSKRALYNPEMEYWLEQWAELRRLISGRRIDRQACDDSLRVDEATGIDGLFGFEKDRPKNAEIKRFLEAPDDLAGWAKAAATDVAVALPPLLEGKLELFFPERLGQRMQTRMMVSIPSEVELEPFVEGKIFEEFRVRFLLSAPSDPVPLALVVDRLLRPEQEFLLRLKVSDEISGRVLYLNDGFVVPAVATVTSEMPAVPDEAIVALGEELKQNRISGYDSLLVVPPATDVVFGLWRAEALVTGQRIDKVVFYLDDKQVMSRRRPPFTAELRLETYPKEQVVRVEGYDEDGELVAADEVVLNQPRGELRVRILEPGRGHVGARETQAKAEVTVPEEKRVAAVEFLVNEELQARLERPPWEARIKIPPVGDLSYLTVTAELEDGTRAEDVRFLSNPDFIEEVEVDLVELYTTVTDDNGRLVKGLSASDFEVWEDERPQRISKFELVEDLPLTLGVTIDTSGSMFESLGEAQRAAVEFLESIITPKDRCFALAFSDRPNLLMERTSDVGAVAERLEDLVASGSTALHDAVVTSLYYYRGIRGRRALVILSDGEDTSSTLEFSETLEYARRSGVAIYTIGLRIGKTEIGVRRKLESLAKETGGRTFYIREAADLHEVYDEIEEELRSQYLVAYNSDQAAGEELYREIAMKVKGGKLKSRTIAGYYP